MFPPSSPLVERVRIENEKKLFEHQASISMPKLPGHFLKSLNFLKRKSEDRDNAQPDVRRTEVSMAKNV